MRRPALRLAAAGPRPTALALAAAAALAAVAPAGASAGGCRDLEDAWLIAPGRLALLLSPAADQTREPGQTPDAGAGQGAWLALSLAQLYGMPELPLRAVAAGWGFAGLGWSASWQRLGADALREDRLRWRILRGGERRAGLTLGLDRLLLGGRQVRRQASLAAEVVWPLPGGMQGRLSWPLVTPSAWDRERGWRRWLTLCGGGGRALWAAGIDRALTGEPCLQVEAALRLAAGCGVGARAEPATGTLGLNTGWIWRGVLLRTSHLVHPELGVTHRWSLTLGSAAPDPAP